ncbi:MAG: CBS domain-containing protein, partial [Litorivicinus sp.]
SATAEAPPTTIHPNHDLRTATSTLLRHGLSALPCVDADGQYVGLVTQAGIAEFLAWRTERMREQHA